MFLLWKPSEGKIQKFLDSQKGLPFSYSEIGTSRFNPPSNYIVDHNRIKLGTGKAIFHRALTALHCWKMFDLGWVELFRPDTPIEVGQTVAVYVNHLYFRSLNAARIVYTIDEDGPIKKSGFAYGTLPDHAESGEERFSIEWDRTDDSVWYDLFAFSRPNKLSAKIGYPIARLFQKRFAADSKLAMARVCQ